MAENETMLTYNGMSIREMVDAINTFITEHPNVMIKIHRQSDLPIWIYPTFLLRLKASPNGLYDYAYQVTASTAPHGIGGGAMVNLQEGSDIEQVYRALSEYHGEKILICNSASFEERESFRRRRDRIIVESPQRYGYVPVEIVLGKVGCATSEELIKMLSPYVNNKMLQLPNWLVIANDSTGEQRIVFSEEALQKLPNFKLP